MKNRFYYTILVLGMVALNLSCQKDEEFVIESQELPRVIIETTTLADSKNGDHLENLIKKLNKKTSSYSIEKQTGSSFLNQFTVDTTTVRYIESSISHSYTLSVKSNNTIEPTLIRNLIFAKHNDEDDYVALLMTYNLTEAELNLLENGTYPLAYTNAPEVEVIDGLDPSTLGFAAKRSCVRYETITFEVLCSHPNCVASDAHDDGICGHPDIDSITVTITEPCPASNNTGSSGTDDSSGSSGGGGGFSWGGSNDNPNDVDQSYDFIVGGPLTKLVLPRASLVRTQMSDLLDVHDTNFLNNYPNVETAFNNYLFNNTTTESFAFVDWSIDYLQILYLSSHSQVPGLAPTTPENAILFDGIIDDFEDIIGDLEFHKLAREAEAEGGEVDFNDNVILSEEFKNNIKLKCVYDKLAGDNSTLFRDTIGAFVGNRDVNLVLTIGDCNGAAAGCTQTNYVAETGIITIKIEDINETPIEIAQTILHEAIHAELAKYVLEHDNTVDTDDRPRLFELYKFYRELDVPERHIDHPYMALNYITPISSALRLFDNNQNPLNHYKSLAWIGLEDFDVNGVLTEPMINTYSQYLSTVIENSTACN